jgi:hypothetical protein
MGENGCSFGIKPFVAVRMIEVPMGVDQKADRIIAEAVDSLQDPQTRCGDASIYEYFAVRPGEDSDVAAGTFEYTDVVTELVDGDRGLGGIVTD